MAAPAEARAARAALGLHPPSDGRGWTVEKADLGFDLLETGVGKAQAAAATARCLDENQHIAVLNVGIGGVLPESGLSLGRVVLGSVSQFGDEGSESPEGFVSLDVLGFTAGRFGKSGAAVDPRWRRVLEPMVDAVGVIATVSTCSGTDARAHEIARRTGAAVEAMEGAAVAAALAGLSLAAPPPFAEVRIVSNTTGDRRSQQWDLAGSLAVMEAWLARLAHTGPDLVARLRG